VSVPYLRLVRRLRNLVETVRILSLGATIEPLCEPRRDAKGSSYVKPAIVQSRTRIVWKNARFHILRTSGLALR
jgi:hypothetical protein